MTIAEQLTRLRDLLADWARRTGSSVAIAGDPAHLWNLLAAKPGTVRCILLFDAETPRGDLNELGRVDRKYLLILSRGRLLTYSPSDALTRASAGGPPLYELVEEAREIIRGAVVESADDIDETVTEYLRLGRMDAQGLIADAYQIEFTLAAQIPVAGHEARDEWHEESSSSSSSSSSSHQTPDA